MRRGVFTPEDTLWTRKRSARARCRGRDRKASRSPRDARRFAVPACPILAAAPIASAAEAVISWAGSRLIIEHVRTVSALSRFAVEIGISIRVVQIARRDRKYCARGLIPQVLIKGRILEELLHRLVHFFAKRVVGHLGARVAGDGERIGRGGAHTRAGRAPEVSFRWVEIADWLRKVRWRAFRRMAIEASKGLQEGLMEATFASKAIP